jgi:hypothetical protein
MQKVKITSGHIAVTAQLTESPTARKIADALPLKGRAMRWGAEVYFSIPLQIALEADARHVLKPGELGYWPAGRAFCIFWGRTPVSHGDEPRAASDVNVFGNVQGETSILDGIHNEDEIFVEKL